MDWDSVVRMEEGIKEIGHSQFIEELEKRLDGKKYKSKRWSNYPNSTFYYFENDNVMQDEIAIYTAPTAWAIYVDGNIRWKRKG
jgi:hypothetical protein